MKRILLSICLITISVFAYSQVNCNGTAPSTINASDKIGICNGNLQRTATVGQLMAFGIDTTKVYSIAQGRGSSPFLLYFNGTAWAKNDTSYIPLNGTPKLSGDILARTDGLFRYVGYLNGSKEAHFRFGHSGSTSTFELYSAQGGGFEGKITSSSSPTESVLNHQVFDPNTSQLKGMFFDTRVPTNFYGDYIKGDSVYRDNDSLRYVQLKDAQERFAPIGGSGTIDSTLSIQVKYAESIANGQAVYVSGGSGTNIQVSKASNTTEATSSKTLGLAMESGATNHIARIITEGILNGLNTDTAAIGEPVWLGTSGNLIYGLSGKPIAPAHLVYIGVVTRAHATQGEIFVKIQNGFELNEIHDVLLTSLANNDVLTYESSSGLWKNKQVSLNNLTLNDGQIPVGDGTNKAFGRTPNGDVTISNLGVTTIDSTKWAKKIIDLYIIAGQSNAQGNGSNPSSGSPTNDISYAIQYYNKTLSVCNDPVGNAVNASAWPAFAQSYYKLTGRAICVVPTAVGGTSQTCAADVGNGNWDTCGVLVDSSIVKTNRAILALRALGWTVNIKGVLWAQGEADAGAINSTTITQANYIAAFTKMRRRFRTSFGKIPFYIFQTGTRIIDSDVGYESIRQAQVNASRIDSLSNIVFYGAITYQRRGLLSDNVHYNNIGYNEMGRTGAENIVGAFKSVQAMGDRKNLFNTSGYLNYTNLGFNTSKVATMLHLNRTITDTVPTSAYDATTDPILISGNSYQQMIGYVASSSAGDRFIIKGEAAGGTVLSPSIVATGRTTFSLVGSGHDGSSFINSGRINFITSGTPSSGNVPMDVTVATGTTTSPSERLRVTADGNVGIGTASPASKLHIEATAATSTRENIARYSVSDASTDFGLINNATFGDNAFALGFGAIRNTSNATPMQFSGYTTSANDNGTSPLLQFYCGITSSSTDPANGTITAIATRPIMALNNQANRLVTVLAGGGVGIGMSTPATKLDVYSGSLGGTAGNTVGIAQVGMPTTNVMQLNTTGVRLSTGTSWREAAIRQQLTVDASNGMGYIQFEGFAASDNVGGISFGTVNSGATAPFSVPEQMRITNIGNVGIGVVTPTAFLHLKAGTTSYAPFRIAGGVAPTSPNTFDVWSETTNNRLMFRQNATSVEVLGVSAVNTVTPTLQNRTITVVINGTTYYITAKTTND